MKTKQELHCHNCQSYVQFDVDMELEGQYILDCPKCGHKHYRVVKNGEITDERWGQDPSQNNFNTYIVSNATYTTSSTYTLYTTATNTASFTTGAAQTVGQYMLYQSWMNTTC
jgi:hypothetical protein